MGRLGAALLCCFLLICCTNGGPDAGYLIGTGAAEGVAEGAAPEGFPSCWGWLSSSPSSVFSTGKADMTGPVADINLMVRLRLLALPASAPPCRLCCAPCAACRCSSFVGIARASPSIRASKPCLQHFIS